MNELGGGEGMKDVSVRTAFVRPWAQTEMVFSENQEVIWYAIA